MIKDERYRIAVLNADDRHYKENRTVMSEEERTAFGEELLLALNGNYRQEKERLFDTFKGFDVILPAYMTIKDPHIILRRRGGGTYKVDMKENNALTCSRALDGVLISFGRRVSSIETVIRKLETQLKEIKTELSKGNPYDYEAFRLKDELGKIDDLLGQER